VEHDLMTDAAQAVFDRMGDGMIQATSVVMPKNE
jgi:hypothetical protein